MKYIGMAAANADVLFGPQKGHKEWVAYFKNGRGQAVKVRGYINETWIGHPAFQVVEARTGKLKMKGKTPSDGVTFTPDVDNWTF